MYGKCIKKKMSINIEVKQEVEGNSEARVPKQSSLKHQIYSC